MNPALYFQIICLVAPFLVYLHWIGESLDKLAEDAQPNTRPPLPPEAKGPFRT